MPEQASSPRLLIAGHINLETTLQVDAFPITYAPVRYPFYGVNTTVAGVGYNLTAALTTLGNTVDLLALVGQDDTGTLVYDALRRLNVAGDYVLPALQQTAQSVILYDGNGQRAIYTDLKDIQEHTYPADVAERALATADLAVICNINFSRPLLARAHALNVPIATDVHAISDIHDDYNRDYMAHAHILFQSHERLPGTPTDWIKQVWATYATPIVVVGMGSQGALLGIHTGESITHVPAVSTRPVINTVGAGDALFAAFLHTYAHTQDARLALRKAVVFASYKIGVAGAAEGFLNTNELDDEWSNRVD